MTRLKTKVTLIAVLFIVLAGFLFLKLSKYNPAGYSEIHVIKETCLDCHTGVTGFVSNHNPQKIGCSSCHLGNPKATLKEQAHKDMILIPGNLSNATKTCGTTDCHPGIPQRVELSLMNTMSGVVTINHYAFGESDSLSGKNNIQNIGNSPADTHLRNLCASCHLGREKKIAEPIHEKSRGGGCNACHLNYDKKALEAHYQYHSDEVNKPFPLFHPSLSLKVENDHCFGCHSRSGRISTSYEGWHETKLKPEEIKNKQGYRILEDKRVFTYISEDVHHAKGLACIDCHNASEVMGDGIIYEHEEEAVKIDCEDCHFTETPKTLTFDELDYESQRIVELRKISHHNKKFVIGKHSKMPMLNVFLNEETQPVLQQKNTAGQHVLSPPDKKCSVGNAHDDLACSSCHTAWAPQCISCHTQYNKNLKMTDLLDRKKRDGKWIEYSDDYFVEFPTLGVIENGEKRKIKTFIPGMIMSIDKSEFSDIQNDTIHQRLFAPIEAHTISKEGKNCKDCHNNPVALGYGRGELIYKINKKTGSWEFSPTYENWHWDGLPKDAWIGFLKEKGKATRQNAHPLSVEQQKRILTVGSCLTCHNENSKVINDSLYDFQKVLKNMTDECVMPEF